MYICTKGGKQTTNKWAIRVQLTKPVTWVPLIWGVACGAAAAGNIYIHTYVYTYIHTYIHVCVCVRVCVCVCVCDI